MTVLRIVSDTINRCGLLVANDKLVVGVSGGPDSVTLLLLLNSLQKEFKLRLFVTHLDHQLRKDSHKDAEFVSLLAKKLQLPYFSKKVKIARRKNKSSIEELAREERLKFLFAVAKKVGAKKIALGHNKDDQAETVLMRLIRGAGLLGLGAILPKRKIQNYIVIRPLIDAPRRAIEAYLRRRRIIARLDISNKDNVFFRNRIRNCLLPELAKQYNPNIKAVLANFAQTAACDYDYLIQVAQRLFPKLKKPLARTSAFAAVGLRLKLDELGKLHPAIQRLLFRISVASIKGSTCQLNFKHIKEIEDLISSRPVRSIVDLPRGVSVSKDRQYLCVYNRKTSRKT